MPQRGEDDLGRPRRSTRCGARRSASAAVEATFANNSPTRPCRRRTNRSRRAPSGSGWSSGSSRRWTWLARGRGRKTAWCGGLTVAQYRNTLRELLQLEDDLTDDAAARRRFARRIREQQRHAATLAAAARRRTFEIAEEALDRCIVDPRNRSRRSRTSASIWGPSINPEPCPDELILGANSLAAGQHRTSW